MLGLGEPLPCSPVAVNSRDTETLAVDERENRELRETDAEALNAPVLLGLVLKLTLFDALGGMDGVDLPDFETNEDTVKERLRVGSVEGVSESMGETDCKLDLVNTSDFVRAIENVGVNVGMEGCGDFEMEALFVEIEDREG